MYGSIDNEIKRPVNNWHRLAPIPVILLILLAYQLWSSNIEVPPSQYLNQPVYSPKSNKTNELYHSEQFRNESLKRYQQALQIPTEVFDFSQEPQSDMTGWEPFLKLHEYFETTYPLIHSHCSIYKVNKLGYIVIWNGTQLELEPLVFAAHQDVVPVDKETLELWKYPPFSAHYDGRRVWSRGAGDTKNLVVSLMETFEELLRDGFIPKRTMIITLGYDEEAIGRYRGAVSLASYLVDIYGEKNFYAVLDEGGSLAKFEDVILGNVVVNERGYLDMYVELQVPGGHSSLPPDHTGIGIMSELVVQLEADPFEHELTWDNPLLDTLRVVGERSLTLDPKTKEQYIRAKYDDKIRRQLGDSLSKIPVLKYLQRTSQAVDIIHAGIKINALPEAIMLGINHRVSMELTAQECIDRVIAHTKLIAEEYGFTLVLQNGTELVEGEVPGLFNVSWVQPLDSSPISTTLDKTWDILVGSIKHTFQNVIPLAEDLPVAPMITGGYTDARRYWELSDHVYRFIGQFGGGSNIHAIDESFVFDSHIQTVCFLYDYILNVDLYN
jgi:Gly-Xaa carboxypeptidase